MKGLKTQSTGTGANTARLNIAFTISSLEIAWSMAYQVEADTRDENEALAAAEALGKGEVLDYLRGLLWSQGTEAFQDPAIFCDSKEYEARFLEAARRKFAKEFAGEQQKSWKAAEVE